jgi:hypothetical protein
MPSPEPGYADLLQRRWDRVGRERKRDETPLVIGPDRLYLRTRTSWLVAIREASGDVAASAWFGHPVAERYEV